MGMEDETPDGDGDGVADSGGDGSGATGVDDGANTVEQAADKVASSLAGQPEVGVAPGSELATTGAAMADTAAGAANAAATDAVEGMSAGRVHVHIRVRPQLPSEAGQSAALLRCQGVGGIEQLVPRGEDSEEAEQKRRRSTMDAEKKRDAAGYISRKFQFDRVFGPACTQVDVGDAILPDAVTALLNGYHATIFCYGQTGSGKTFTMDGYQYQMVGRGGGGGSADAGNGGGVKITRSPERVAGAPRFSVVDPEDESGLGMAPRAIRLLFSRLAQRQHGPQADDEVTVECSFLQVYNETILDLLSAEPEEKGAWSTANTQSTRLTGIGSSRGLRMRWSPDREFYVENLTHVACDQAEDAIEVYKRGVGQKVMASHRMNATSSRSHCMFTIDVTTQRRDQADETDNTSKEIHSRLCLVDLAGSESLARTGAKGQRMKESIGINKSLFTLRKVIQTLAQQQQQQMRQAAAGAAEATAGAPKNGSSSNSSNNNSAMVPYRDSKLTALLKHGLGGNSKTFMVACVSPTDANFADTLSTLQYATHASSIVNTPTVNLDPKSKIISKLREEIQRLQRELRVTQQALVSAQARAQESSEPSTMLSSSSPSPIVTTVAASPQKQNQQARRGAAPSQPRSPSAQQAAQSSEQEGGRRGSTGRSSFDPRASTAVEKAAHRKAMERALEAAQKAVGSSGTVKNIRAELQGAANLIAGMVETENVLRNRITEFTDRLALSTRENRGLKQENRALRDKVDMLEYVIATSESTQTYGDDPLSYVTGVGATEHIPEYGETSTTPAALTSSLQNMQSTQHERVGRELARLQQENQELRARLQMPIGHKEVPVAASIGGEQGHHQPRPEPQPDRPWALSPVRVRESPGSVAAASGDQTTGKQKLYPVQLSSLTSANGLGNTATAPALGVSQSAGLLLHHTTGSATTMGSISAGSGDTRRSVAVRRKRAQAKPRSSRSENGRDKLLASNHRGGRQRLAPAPAHAHTQAPARAPAPAAAPGPASMTAGPENAGAEAGGASGFLTLGELQHLLRAPAVSAPPPPERSILPGGEDLLQQAPEGLAPAQQQQPLASGLPRLARRAKKTETVAQRRSSHDPSGKVHLWQELYS